MLDNAARTTGSVGEGVGGDAVNLAGADGGDVDVVKFFRRGAGVDLRAVHFGNIRELLHLPALGDVAEGGGDARVLFVAGEAEVDEPLAVEGAGHRLQEPDAPLTVLHQLVVGRQDARDPPLHRQRGKLHLHSLQKDNCERRLR